MRVVKIGDKGIVSSVSGHSGIARRNQMNAEVFGSPVLNFSCS